MSWVFGVHQGCQGCMGELAGSVGAQGPDGVEVASGGIGAPRGVVGIGVHQGCGGVRGVLEMVGGLGAQPHWAPVKGPSTPTGSPWGVTYLTKARQGPFPGSRHSHWFPLGSDLPGQDQASDRNELCRLLYTFGTIFHDSLHICIYATSSHILTCNVKKCYRDYVLCRPIYAYPYTINLTYYNTMVLITKNYFSHQTSELGTSDCKCQADLM